MNQHYGDIAGLLMAAVSAAIATLVNHLDGEKPGPCIQAAKALCEFSQQARRDGDFDARIAHIERAVSGRTQDDSTWAPWYDGSSNKGRS